MSLSKLLLPIAVDTVRFATSHRLAWPQFGGSSGLVPQASLARS